jgi:serine/threonine protein kinase
MVQTATAQTAPAAAQDAPEQVVITGTRVADRSAPDTAVPVDVVSGESFRNLGVTEVTQVLSVSLPSYNFPRPGLADGTDTIRPATPRGLSPDETLVLVNGKRRQSAALRTCSTNTRIRIPRSSIPPARSRSRTIHRSAARADSFTDERASISERQGGCVHVDPEQWPNLSRLLDEALEVPLEARERWLESLPPADVTYKAKLRALLGQGASAETRDFLDVFPKLPMAEAASGALSGPALAPGTAVGPYVIEEEIGRGGMGAVWRARRSDGVIKRPVALKLPHTGLYGRDLIAQFASERDILAELAHPNIARLYDAGFSAAGQPFLALEYVAGVPLTAYCDQHRLDVPRRLRLFQQVLRAVQYAHGHLVIHRDLKPSNVIVGPDGRAMLLDFGVAKLVVADAGEEAGRTQMGVRALTPEYASPEQIAGQPVTTASDIYSLGVLLFELLTGGCPYRVRHSSRAALEEAILTAEPQRPSQSIRDEGAARGRATTVKALCRALRGDLDTIILKALKKATAERYATADALSQDIERYLRGEPVAARPDSGWYRTSKFIARHKLSVAAGGAALAAVLATAAIALFEARAADAERDRALALSSRSEAVAEFLNVLITEAAGADKPVTVSDMLARSEALVSSEYRDNPEHRAAVLGMLGSYYYTNEKHVRAESLLREALDTVKASADGDLRRKLTCNHALTMTKLGKVPEAIRVLNRVIDEPQITAQQSAECLEDLALIALEGTDAPNALKFGNLALQRLHQAAHPSPALEADLLGNIGFAEHLNGRNGVAGQFFERALAQFARAGRDRGPAALAVLSNWALVSDGAGNPKRALELDDQVLRIVVQNDPAAPPPPTLLYNRARELEYIGRYRESREAYLQCLAQAGRTDTPANKVNCLLGLASVSHELGDLVSADSYLASAVPIIGTSISPGFPEGMRLRNLRGLIALTKGRLEEARANLDAVVAESKSAYLTMAALRTRAEVNLNEGKVAAAEADAQRALALAQAAQGGMPHSNRTGLAWLILGRVLAKQADEARAQSAFHAAAANLSNTVDADHPMLLLAQQLVRE